MERIGVRELRQNASQYLARVARGESIEVTDRGRAVAVLVPIRGDRWEELVTSGQILPSLGDGTVLDEAPVDYGINASRRLAEIRAEER
jgi:prevent-host-death family protein